METLRLFPLFPDFDMHLLPVFLAEFGAATLTEEKGSIFADVIVGSFDLQLKLVADQHHPFKYRVIHGQKMAISGDIAQIAVTASSPGFSLTALKATGLHAPVADFLHDLLGLESQDALVDLAEPGPITVKPAGLGDTLYVASVHARFDLRGVPGHELVELKHGDKVEVSDEKFHNVNDLKHDLTSDGHGGWLLAEHNDMANSIDLQLANGQHLTKAEAFTYLMLDA
jgi:hypothetical protein